MTARIRTSLSRAPSSFTPEQITARSRKEQVAAAATGLLVVSVNDDRLPWPEKQMVEHLLGWVVGRAGK